MAPQHVRTVTLQDVVVGDGVPKVIVPLTDPDLDSLLTTTKNLLASPADIIEWRADTFADKSPEALREVTTLLRRTAAYRPFIFTVRTADQGGAWDIGDDAYVELIAAVCADATMDAIDVQASHPGAAELIATAERHRMPVIGSHHDFTGTGSVSRMVARLETITRMGVQIAKLAVMPTCPADVASLLAATAHCAAYLPIPLITMAMGELGKVSRISGEIFGSSATFATHGPASAPGQLPLTDVLTGQRLLELPTA